MQFLIMSKKFKLLYTLIFALALTACGNSDDDLVGNWIVVDSDFGGQARANASSFTIGNKLYVFGGYNGRTRFNDLWEVEIPSGTRTFGTWKQLASLDASSATVTNATTANYGRSEGVGFSIGSVGYIGAGYDGSNYMKDFWKYDPATDSWTQVADFAGSGRYGAYAFALKDKGYVGGGYDGNYLNDFYQYDPTTDAWTVMPSAGRKREYASAFVINDVAYVVGGRNSTTYPIDFLSFDGTEWTLKRQIANVSDDSYDDDYSSIARSSASTFVLNGKAYLAGGTSGSLLRTVWEYDPTTDIWTEKTSFEATARTGAVGVALNGRGFILLGKSGSSYFDDINEFFPDQDANSSLYN